MGKNILHHFQGLLLGLCSPYIFLRYSDVNGELETLTTNIRESGFAPNVVVGVSKGGDYPALQISGNLNTPLTKIEINHYGIKFGGFEFDEIIGIYRLARLLGYKPNIQLDEDIPYEDVRDKKVLIVDDDSYSGNTLDTAIKSVKAKSPLEVKTAVIHTYEGNPFVDFSGRLFPREEYYKKRRIFPWSKMSPHYEDRRQVETIERVSSVSQTSST